MKSFSCVIFLMALGLVSIGLLPGQEKSPTERLPSDLSIPYQSLIAFDPGAATPFAVNPTVAKDLLAADEEIARQEFESIKAKLATFIRQYPDTKAGKAAADMIDRAGLCAGPPAHNSLYPKGTHFGYIIIDR